MGSDDDSSIGTDYVSTSDSLLKVETTYINIHYLNSAKKSSRLDARLGGLCLDVTDGDHHWRPTLLLRKAVTKTQYMYVVNDEHS
uniref:Neur_chan_LBD domain-containing protein n=1 Tax=Steinernema glaseri TaxID=37863 RepID=A0A1I7Y7X4_9BILA